MYTPQWGRFHPILSAFQTESVRSTAEDIQNLCSGICFQTCFLGYVTHGTMHLTAT